MESKLKGLIFHLALKIFIVVNTFANDNKSIELLVCNTGNDLSNDQSGDINLCHNY